MKRLTERNHIYHGCEFMDSGVYVYFNRLAEYENTNRTPDQIKTLITDFENLACKQGDIVREIHEVRQERDYYKERIAKWLERYIDIKDCRYGYGDDKIIRQSIKLLLDEMYTRDELKKDALKHGDIILSDEMINRLISEIN